VADAFLPDAGQIVGQIVLPQRLLQAEGPSGGTIIFIAVPEQQRTAGQGRQLLADVPRRQLFCIERAKEKRSATASE
jgi:ribosomal protein S18 acetylase RimI-like enzyme